jgi:hypothetical protein
MQVGCEHVCVGYEEMEDVALEVGDTQVLERGTSAGRASRTGSALHGMTRDCGL